MATHEIKCTIKFFDAVRRKVKSFEVRKNDRNYRSGDTLVLKEWDPAAAAYTGRFVEATVLWVLHGPFQSALNEGHCIMSITHESVISKRKKYPVTDKSLDALADKMLNLDAAGIPGDYTQYDLNNALLVLNRLAGSLNFRRYEKGIINAEQTTGNAEGFGSELRQLVIKYIGLDPHAIAQDMGAISAEHR